jgi:hypothetical protein
MKARRPIYRRRRHGVSVLPEALSSHDADVVCMSRRGVTVDHARAEVLLALSVATLR